MADIYSMLTHDEGLQLLAYDDANGVKITPGYKLIGHPTIGIGLALDTDGITPDEANYLLSNRVSAARRSARSFDWFQPLDSVRQDVVVMMIFNMGFNNFLQFKQMIAAMGVKDYQSAASQMLNSKWAASEGKRAAKLAGMMTSGVYPD